MTTESQTDVSSNGSSTVNIDIGRTLKASRIEQKLDERQISTELKIPLDQVMALEDNRFEYFKSSTFARGYLKSYCRLLNLDAKEILAAFDALVIGSKSESNIKPVDKVTNKQVGFGDPFVILVSIVIIAVLIFLAFWWPTFSSNNSAVIQKETSPEQTQVVEDSSNPKSELTASSEVLTTNVEASDTASDTSISDDPVIDKSVAVQDANVTTGLSAETIALLEEAGVNPQKVEAATREVAADDVTTDNVSVSATPSYTNDVEVTFDADCWIEIRSGTGKILFSGVKASGSQLAVTGTAPYRVVVGYARGVSSFKFKGEVYDFSSYIHKDLARFELK